MVKALFDTCILIDYLNGYQKAKNELDQYSEKLISSISWMEVLIGSTDENEKETRQWLMQHFKLIEVDQNVSELAVKVRKEFKMKLPDAIILATAHHHQCLFVTRNIKDFDKNNPMIRVPYKL
jgi:predicted nucleic acid-binding protein